ncbi:MAG: hypothetical protein NZU63_00315 [Gemmataceae bacterium]|nr:hypothetical protein [Gemmataceae bacterium]MDW8241708.1 hypothetical protein [Thermogemmata sp.]
MTPESVRESEFIFRRLGESFQQFLGDLWASVPVGLVALTLILLALRIGYLRYHRRRYGLGRPPRYSSWINGALFLSTALTVGAFFLAFYQRDISQMHGDPATTGMTESNPLLWYVFVAGLLVAAIVYVAVQYGRDSRSIRWWWAVPLALLRLSVYAILLTVFLLPARQTWERTEKRSRVVVLVDVSPSMTQVSDELSGGPRTPRTRIEQLIEFLTDEQIQFVHRLLQNNPVVVYAFGSRLDETPQTIERNGTPWSKEEWTAFVNYDFRPFLLRGLSPAGREALQGSTVPDWGGPRPLAGQRHAGPVQWADWAAQWYARRHEGLSTNPQEPTRPLVPGLSPEDDAILRDNLHKLDRRIEVARAIVLGTNVPDAVLAAVNREAAHMTQGIIVFSDGRSNLGSDAVIREVRQRATREKIPIFTVAVGVERRFTAITITEVQTDDVVAPDQGFKVAVHADGINLANQSVPVELDVFYLGKDARVSELKDRQPDFTFNAQTHPRKVPYQITFAPGDPPHGSVEFEVDPARLQQFPEGSRLTEESKDTAIKKPVLKEGVWAVRARIPRQPDEAFPEPEHIRDRLGIQVQQKVLRVLLWAAAAHREFQFLRTFLMREAKDKRVEVSLLVQNEAGRAGQLTPNPEERLLRRFPDRLDLSDKKVAPEDKGYNLNEYDLIVALDPDWSEITQTQAELLQTWVQRQGGGLIFVADRINTPQLLRRGMEAGSQLNPILEILPVLPDDIIAVKIRAVARTPRRLYLNPIPGSDLLQLEEPSVAGEANDKGADSRDPVAGWERFFTDRDRYSKQPDYKVELFPRRGFYSCYPVKEVKPGAHVLAEFAEIDERGELARRPFLVTNNPAAAWRTAFLASPELYRLHAYPGRGKEYYERFWGKLLRYVAAKRNVKASRGRILISKEFRAGSLIRLQAQILDPSSRPYPVEGGGAISPKFSIWRIAPTSEQPELVEAGIPLQPKLSGGDFEGYYSGQIVADPRKFPPEGEYLVRIEVPDSAGEILQSRFNIIRANPELDNTAPDHAALLALASPFDTDLQRRVPERVRTVWNQQLPKDESGLPKLKFALEDRTLLSLIPDCFRAEEQSTLIRGPIHDLWDRGIELPQRQEQGQWWQRLIPSAWSGKYLPVSWLMLLIIALLCSEWAMRKFLRLA